LPIVFLVMAGIFTGKVRQHPAAVPVAPQVDTNFFQPARPQNSPTPVPQSTNDPSNAFGQR